MITYHQLLNRLLSLLPEFFDELADISLVDDLREREVLLSKKAHLPYEKRVMGFDF